MTDHDEPDFQAQLDSAEDELEFSPDDQDSSTTAPAAHELERAASDSGNVYAAPASTLIELACAQFLDPAHLPRLRAGTATAAKDGLLGLITTLIDSENTAIKQGRLIGAKRNPINRLGFREVAALISALHTVINITPSERNSDPDLDMLALYDSDPQSPGYGTYRTAHGYIRGIARRYCPDLTTREFTEVLAALQDSAPRRVRGTDRDLIACRNGIVNYRGGDPVLLPFSSEHIFLSKLDVDFNPDAQNVTIVHPDDGTEWDVESWMAELSDDPEVVHLLWEVIGAVCRPYVSWNKSAWFYSEIGNNGKGTLLALMRNICGPQSYASIPLVDFGKDFMLEPLTRATAILVDENDVGGFVDRAANLKAVITNDVISINRKYKNPIAYQFYGFMVQCLNEFPKIRDKSESFYRRQLFIPFTKSFTGIERKYIKDDYLARPEVLEYVLLRVLTMEYYSLSEPDAVKNVLSEYKEYNDPVRAFWYEMQGRFAWDLLPFQFIYELYLAWMELNQSSTKPLGRNTFIKDLAAIVRQDTNGRWLCEDTGKIHRVSGRMSGPEELINQFNLDNWVNVIAPGTRNRKLRCTLDPSQISQAYRGLVRKTPSLTPPAKPTKHAGAPGPIAPVSPTRLGIESSTPTNQPEED